MKKIILSGIALVAGLVSCTEDYTNWGKPQSNTANDPQTFVLMVELTASSIDFATYTAETVQLFTTNVAEGQTEGYTVTISADNVDGTKTIKTDAEGKVATSELRDIVVGMFGKAPTPRTLTLAVEAIVKNVSTADGTVTALAKAAPFTLTATLDAPFIDPDGYYYIGTLTTNKVYKLDNGGGNPYDNPVFSVTIPASNEFWHWFKIAPASAFNEDGTFDWGKEEMCICPEIKDDEGRSGKCTNGKFSWHLLEDDGAISYIININVMDMTYEFKSVSGTYYAVGSCQKDGTWDTGSVECMFYGLGDGKYEYTTQWKNQWSLKIINGADVAPGNWGALYGSEVDGSTDATGAILAGGNAFGPSNDGGLYTLTIDMKNMNYAWTAASVEKEYTHIGLIGVGGDWDNDIDMAKLPDAPHNWYLRYTITSDTQFKFRANRDKEWKSGDWGGDGSVTIDSNNYFMPTGGNNIDIKAGTYDFYFNDITKHWNAKLVE